MAKRRPVRKVEEPKTETRRRVRRVTEKPEVVVSEKAKVTRWFGVNPWIVIVVVIAVLLLIFLPIYPATKTVEKTETVMTTVTKERPEEVTVEETIKVYTGWLQERGTTVARSSYTIRYDYWGNPYYVPYTYYDTAKGSTTTVDAVDEIVEIQYTRGPNDTWTITLRAYDGTETVHRDIASYDLTKTGKATVPVTKTISKTYTEEVPQQVTRQETLKLRVNLISLIFGTY